MAKSAKAIGGGPGTTTTGGGKTSIRTTMTNPFGGRKGKRMAKRGPSRGGR